MRIYLFMVCLIVVASSASAQELRLNVYTAYAFDDKFDSYYDPTNYYEGKIDGGLQWGAGLQYFPRENVSVELLYLRQDTHAPTRYQTNTILVQNADFDLGINYIMVAGGRHFRQPGAALEGFAGLMAGVVVVGLDNPDNHRSSSVSKFAWGVRGGGIYWTSDRVGIKLQAQLLSAVQSMGGGFYFGTGGTGAGVSSYSTIYQFGLGGGFVFRLK